MTEFPIADTPKPVGRPPLKKDIVTKATMVRLTEDVRQEIEAIVGKNRMAAFIREAIVEKIAREKDKR